MAEGAGVRYWGLYLRHLQGWQAGDHTGCRESGCKGRRGRVHGTGDESLTEALRSRESQNSGSDGGGTGREVVRCLPRKNYR